MGWYQDKFATEEEVRTPGLRLEGEVQMGDDVFMLLKTPDGADTIYVPCVLVGITLKQGGGTSFSLAFPIGSSGIYKVEHDVQVNPESIVKPTNRPKQPVVNVGGPTGQPRTTVSGDIAPTPAMAPEVPSTVSRLKLVSVPPSEPSPPTESAVTEV